MTSRKVKNIDSSDTASKSLRNEYQLSPDENIINVEESQFDLKKIISAIIRRKKIILVFSSSFFLLALIHTGYKRIFKPTFQGSFKVLIDNPLADDNLSLANVAANSFFSGSIRGSILSELPTLYAYLKSPQVLNQVSKKYDLSPNQLSKMLFIKSGENEGPKAKGILTVKLSSNDKKQGEKILNDISNLYIDLSQSRRKEELLKKLDFLEKQIPITRNKIAQASASLAKLQTTYNFVTPESDAQNIKSNIEQIELLIRDINLQIKRLLELESQIKNEGVVVDAFTEKIIFPDGSNFTIKSFKGGILSEYIKLNMQLAAAKLKFKPNSFSIKNIEAKIKEITPLTKEAQIEAIKTAINLNNQIIFNKKKEIESLKNEFSEKPKILEKYNNLSGQIEFDNKAFYRLITAKESVEYQLTQNTSPWIIVSAPTMNSKVISPVVGESIFAGFILSLIGGISVGLIRDRFNFVYHSKEDAIKELGLPVLGSIPFISIFEDVRENKKLNVLKEINNPIETLSEKESYQRFFYKESFRNLYTSLRFLNTEKIIKSVLITSSIPQEGKSLINIILAKTISDLNKKVLLVDADLRKPSIHNRIGINNLKGLSNLITDESLEIKDTIQKIKGEKGFDVITAGLIPPDPSRLLISEKLKVIVNDLQKNYDYDLIIFDAPPILGLSDSSIISKYTDGIILITSINFVQRNLPKDSIATISSNKNSLLGIITNSKKEEITKESAYLYESYYNADNAKKGSIKDTAIENKFDKYLIIWREIEEKVKKIIKDVFEFLDN